jgi:hypothetical protein
VEASSRAPAVSGSPSPCHGRSPPAESGDGFDRVRVADLVRRRTLAREGTLLHDEARQAARRGPSARTSISPGGRFAGAGERRRAQATPPDRRARDFVSDGRGRVTTCVCDGGAVGPDRNTGCRRRRSASVDHTAPPERGSRSRPPCHGADPPPALPRVPHRYPRPRRSVAGPPSATTTSTRHQRKRRVSLRVAPTSGRRRGAQQAPRRDASEPHACAAPPEHPPAERSAAADRPIRTRCRCRSPPRRRSTPPPCSRSPRG